MTTTTVHNLTDLAARLQGDLNNPASFGAVITRLLLRTGVNLRTPKPDQVNDRAVVSRLSDTLAEMGYRF